MIALTRIAWLASLLAISACGSDDPSPNPCINESPIPSDIANQPLTGTVFGMPFSPQAALIFLSSNNLDEILVSNLPRTCGSPPQAMEGELYVTTFIDWKPGRVEIDACARSPAEPNATFNKQMGGGDSSQAAALVNVDNTPTTAGAMTTVSLHAVFTGNGRADDISGNIEAVVCP